MEDRPVKIPSPLLSFVPIIVLVGLLFFTIRIFGSGTLDGASQIVLLAATAVCVLIAMSCCRIRWKTIEAAIVQNITSVTVALLILLLIGALSGSWMVSGIIPTMIYYGVQIIRPDIFLVSTCLICILVSVMTGSSWTTIATIGIALYGIGKVQGFGDGWIAGAIISGAYFGDKVSPLSDTTVLASSVTETPLFKHIQYMMITTVPSIVITLGIFLFAGFMHHTVSSESILGFTQRLDATYRISLWLLIVPVVMGVLIARRTPALVTLFVSAALAGVFALFFQPNLLRGIAETETGGAASLFEGLLRTFYGGTAVETGDETLNELVKTRGMAGMMNTIWLIICAMCFGGAMTASNMLASITSVFLRFMKRTVGLVGSTVFSGIFLNICTADQYLSIILTGNMFKHIYKHKGYESRLLSRTLEDGVTVTSPLVPWNTCGMTQSAVLGVSTFTYLPYCFFNIISPLMSILVAMTGYKIIKKIKSDEENQDLAAR
ncbi:MAG: sodium:proton antiporter [Tannerella sp.]|jgi:NhaC family Na+:H+ antiporter|nr:sodium:proton antiporter [Tannerella sp.]